jgi:hypothetical protein
MSKRIFPTEFLSNMEACIQRTGVIAPSSFSNGLACTAVETRVCWEGANAAAEATREARTAVFMVVCAVVLCGRLT